jgi:hypothetical protein
MLRSLIVPFFFSIGSVAFEQQTIVVPHEFQAWEAGGFVPKTLKEAGTNEALIGACDAFKIDCSSSAIASARYATPYVSTGNVQTTAYIDKHMGEEYYEKFVAPPGYTTCKAKIDVGNGSITGGSTFNGLIQRMTGANGDGVGLYAVVPKYRPSGQWVRFRVFVEFVPIGTSLDEAKCWPNNTPIFQCTGETCNTFPGARM